ncbi:MAG: hypothetical protein U9N33_10550, partial [Campylobacterota bacterium]|nr:hypothetical protein [Campylobacterota bacterium]
SMGTSESCFLNYDILKQNLYCGDCIVTRIDEKEILEIEKLKADLQKVIQDLGNDNLKVKYEAWRLAFYGIAVGAGGTFAVAKTLQLLQQ